MSSPAFQPERRWVDALIRQTRKAGAAVYLKPNLTAWSAARIREYPGFEEATA